MLAALGFSILAGPMSAIRLDAPCCRADGYSMVGDAQLAAEAIPDDSMTVGVDQASASVPMPTGRTRPSMLLIDPPPGLRAPPDEETLEPVRRAFRAQCRDLLRVARSYSGARLAANVLEQAAAEEDDPTLKWVFLEESIRLGAASGDPTRIESAVALAAEHFRFDAIGMELEALGDIPLRVLRPDRAAEVAKSAERLATSLAADERPRERVIALGLAADAWKLAGDSRRAAAAKAAARDHVGLP